MTHSDPRAISAAEKYSKDWSGIGQGLKQDFIRGWEARDAASSPESPAPPASPPPEGGLHKSVWLCQPQSGSNHPGERNYKMCPSCIEYVPAALLAEAKQQGRADAEEELWKRLNQWKPTLHFCMEWDFLLIENGDTEFESCSCGPFPLKYERPTPSKGDGDA